MKLQALLMGGCALAICTAASAATISSTSSASYSTPLPGGEGDVFDQETILNVDSSGGPLGYSTDALAAGPGANASSMASVNIATGLLRSRSSTFIEAPVSETGIEAAANATVEIEERVTVIGAGWVSISLAVDGFWSLTRLDGRPLWQAQASLRTGFAGDSLKFDGNDPSIGSVDDVLNLSFFAGDGVVFDVSAVLFTQILNGTGGVVDFSNTAALEITVEQGMSLEYGDSRFLSQSPVVPGQIPLPASGLMMFSALLAGVLLVRQTTI